MRTLTNLTQLTFLATMLIFVSCTDNDPIVLAPTPKLPIQLANYAEPETNLWINQSRYNVTDAGATLGRVLFYDKILSKNNRVSCGTCHLQKDGFAEPVAFSEGINSQILSRNTPAISNCYDDVFLFWDGRAASLEDLALKPIRNHKEMGLGDTDFMMAKINSAPYYDDLFTDAFGSDEVTEVLIADALSQFLSSMISGNSKNDRVNQGAATFNQIETLGQNIFHGEGRCYQCHSGQDLNERGGFFGGWGDPRANIGLDVEYVDNGFGELNSEMQGEFKIPSLRNIAQTGPYMHDGRFATLRDVVNHYNKNIAAHPNLSDELKDWNTFGPVRLGLDELEVNALVKFLETFTDESYLTDVKFSDPFQ